MSHYRIPREAAYQIAVGIYRDIGAFLAAAQRDNPNDYKRFQLDYLEKQSKQKAATVRRRYTRRSQNTSR